MRTRRAACLLVLACGAAPLRAGDGETAPAPGWSGAAELSVVATAGNSEGRSFGFKGEIVRRFATSSWTLRGGGLGAESTTVERRADRLPDGTLAVSERSRSERTAESLFLRGRHDSRLTASWSWFAGAGWERNEFAGISDRWLGVGGMSRTWFDSEAARLSTDAGLTLTREEPVVADPRRDPTFVGVQLSWDYLRGLTPSTTFTSQLALDENLEDTGDLRVDTTQALRVSISRRLALKVGLQLLYDARPARIAIPVTVDGEPTGDTVLLDLDELDSTFTAALVLTY